jgi:hypothetical protein
LNETGLRFTLHRFYFCRSIRTIIDQPRLTVS